MEADGILEGFLNSYQMHGLKYNKLIGINLINYIIIVKYTHVLFLYYFFNFNRRFISGFTIVFIFIF